MYKKLQTCLLLLAFCVGIAGSSLWWMHTNNPSASIVATSGVEKPFPLHDYRSSTATSTTTNQAPVPDEIVPETTPPVANKVPVQQVTPALAQQISSNVAKLQQETCQESLHNLKQVNMFFGPGFTPGSGWAAVGPLLPLSANWGQADIDAILSNRRFRKIFHELSLLSKTEAARLISDELRASMPIYHKMYEEQIAPCREYCRKNKGKKIAVGISFAMGNVPEDQTVIVGIRLKILSLVLLSSQLEIQQSVPETAQVINAAITQRNTLYQDKELSDLFILDLLTMASLYNRQILVMAQIGAAGMDNPKNSTLVKYELKMQTKKLTVYDTEVTKEDLPERSEIMTPDFSKGVMIVKFIQPIDDAKFDAIMANRKESNKIRP